MKTMKKLLAAMLAIAMLLTCAAFNPLTATAEGAATDSSETTRYCGNDDYPAKSRRKLFGNAAEYRQKVR